MISYFNDIAECEELIRKMLQVDPDRRLSLAQILQHRWLALVTSLIITFLY
jgi:serine/threonine protein kinase